MTINQCDGCQAGIPVDANGNHRMGKAGGYPDLMGCEKGRYLSPKPVGTRQVFQGVIKALEQLGNNFDALERACDEFEKNSEGATELFEENLKLKNQLKTAAQEAATRLAQLNYANQQHAEVLKERDEARSWLEKANARVETVCTENKRLMKERDEAAELAEWNRVGLETCIWSENRLTEQLTRLQTDYAAIRTALEALGSEHGCEPGADPTEDADLMCSVCLRAMTVLQPNPGAPMLELLTRFRELAKNNGAANKETLMRWMRERFQRFDALGAKS